jgi:hypothetical protein
MPKFVIEREIPGAGSMIEEQLQAAARKSVEVLKEAPSGSTMRYGPTMEPAEKRRSEEPPSRSSAATLSRGSLGGRRLFRSRSSSDCANVREKSPSCARLALQGSVIQIFDSRPTF